MNSRLTTSYSPPVATHAEGRPVLPQGDVLPKTVASVAVADRCIVPVQRGVAEPVAARRTGAATIAALIGAARQTGVIKAILAAVMADPSCFDRGCFDRLWAEWHALNEGETR
jgi:hypothetical protein